MTCSIEIHGGLVVTVDQVDADTLFGHSWRPKRDTNAIYAQTHIRKADGRRTTTTLHRMIMKPGVGQRVDHVNHNGLDNRRANLRLSTASQNTANSTLMSTNTSGYKGVSWSSSHRKWHAQIREAGVVRSLGFFSDITAAARAYDEAALAVFGPFALTNAQLGRFAGLEVEDRLVSAVRSLCRDPEMRAAVQQALHSAGVIAWDGTPVLEAGQEASA